MLNALPSRQTSVAFVLSSHSLQASGAVDGGEAGNSLWPSTLKMVGAQGQYKKNTPA
jgi:hypothetical protein